MRRALTRWFLLLIPSVVIFPVTIQAQPTASQTIGGTVRQQQDRLRVEELETRIKQDRPGPEGQMNAEEVLDEDLEDALNRALTTDAPVLYDAGEEEADTPENGNPAAPTTDKKAAPAEAKKKAAAAGMAAPQKDADVKKKHVPPAPTTKPKISEEKKKSAAAAIPPAPPDTASLSVQVKSITIEGATLIPADELQNMMSEYEGRKLTLAEMQEAADRVTDLYRRKGFVTSRAYLPPQNMRQGRLTIRVVEGQIGEVTIEGNRYFNQRLLRKRMDFVKKGYFDYSALQRSLVYINEHPDRTARVILLPGETMGTTDVLIKVQDRRPVHFGVQYDNYGSRFIEKDRYALFMEHNNLTGHDDKLYLKAQLASDDHLQLYEGRYSYPVTSTLDVGGYVIFSELDLGGDFSDLEAGGDAEIFGAFVNQTIYQTLTTEVRLNWGFDWKDVTNELLGTVISEDELSVMKTGFDADVSDPWGRTIFTSQLDWGIPDFMGSMDSKSDTASRPGAGGKFTKGVFNLFRLQPLPLETTLLWKNNLQWSNHSLAAAEQFQIGGATSVRGYPVAELSGDSGYYTALEWSMPLYPVPRTMKVPFSDVKLYDALRFVLFYDWATVKLNRVLAGEEENETLRGYGFGVRMNVKDYVELRAEVGYPEGRTPSDGDHAHAWVQAELKY